MLDINYIRKYPDLVRENIKRRNNPDYILYFDGLIKADQNWRNLKAKIDELRSKRNKLSLEVNAAKKAGKPVEKLLTEAKKVQLEIAKHESELEELEKQIKFYSMRIPNLLHESVPAGKDSSENPVIRTWGKPKIPKFELKAHGELAESLGLVDFERAAKVAGRGFNYLKNELAILDLALQRYAIDFLRKKGFTFMETPMMLKRAAYEGVTPLADFENVMYKIEGEDLYMIATSEHPLIAQFQNEVFNEKDLPIKICGLSACFRKEIGAHGVDTKGLFRMHQFNKVEQIVLCKPEESYHLLEEIQNYSEKIIQGLGIPYRVIEICTGDLSVKNAKQYDIEAWFPRQKGYAEVTSASNCTSWQAARLNIRCESSPGVNRRFVHTLNNTALATSRIMVAILENFQQKDGSITIPKILHKYTGFKKIPEKPAITAKKQPQRK